MDNSSKIDIIDPNVWRQARSEFEPGEEKMPPKSPQKARCKNNGTKSKAVEIICNPLDADEYQATKNKQISPSEISRTSDAEEKRRKYKVYLKRVKSSDPISINNVEKILKKHQSSSVPGSREKKYVTNYKISVKSSLDKDQIMPVKRGRICISKVKRPSKVKQAILWEREVNRQISMQKNSVKPQELQPLERIIDEINFNKMKIIADPKIDMDIARGISVLNIFGNHYRHSEAIKIGDNTVNGKGDVAEGIQNLLLGPKCTIRKCSIGAMWNNTHADTKNVSESIVDGTLSLSL